MVATLFLCIASSWTEPLLHYNYLFFVFKYKKKKEKPFYVFRKVCVDNCNCDLAHLALKSDLDMI